MDRLPEGARVQLKDLTHYGIPAGVGGGVQKSRGPRGTVTVRLDSGGWLAVKPRKLVVARDDPGRA